MDARIAPPDIQTICADLAPLLGRLYDRWMDERSREAIDDYRRPITLALPAEVVVEKMTRRPFGCVLCIGTRRYHMTANILDVQCREIA